MKYRSCWPIFILRSRFWSHFLIWKYDTHPSKSLWDIRQNQWTMKYRSQWHTFILRSCVRSYWFIIPNNYVHTWNSLQAIRHNHWTIKYRSQWLTFILRPKVRSYWFILQKYDVLPLKIQGKVTGPWNIGHSILQIFWGQTLGHTDS